MGIVNLTAATEASGGTILPAQTHVPSAQTPKARFWNTR